MHSVLIKGPWKITSYQGCPYRGVPLYTMSIPFGICLSVHVHVYYYCRKRDCLHRLIVVLSEKKKRKELCAFTYSGMEEEVGGVFLVT